MPFDKAVLHPIVGCNGVDLLLDCGFCGVSVMPVAPSDKKGGGHCEINCEKYGHYNVKNIIPFISKLT